MDCILAVVFGGLSFITKNPMKLCTLAVIQPFYLQRPWWWWICITLNKRSVQLTSNSTWLGQYNCISFQSCKALKLSRSLSYWSCVWRCGAKIINNIINHFVCLIICLHVYLCLQFLERDLVRWGAHHVIVWNSFRYRFTNRVLAWIKNMWT